MSIWEINWECKMTACREGAGEREGGGEVMINPKVTNERKQIRNGRNGSCERKGIG